jgi:tetratricopeptide (TPR) repeat protein
LLEALGEGGCGSVWLAEQREPVRRKIALKIIKLGMDTKQIVARFEAERQALALMDHPNIAKVIDAGSTDTGRSYFVMELVRGIPITRFCDENKLATHERLELFIKVCHAIQHAHQKGIIHRDIKPSNVLVTLHDGVPVPKVIDFGIAKATQHELTDKTIHTQFHQFVGTPAYVSPEQAEMSGLDIDTRSDIYSLGVLLYELLAGSTPFDARELMASGLDEMRKTIREKEPVRPSTRLATLGADQLTTTAKRRSADTSKLMHQLKGDLDWIVMKCLEKDRAQRYETANGLAADLKRHLNNEPVLARPPSAAYRFQKAYRRNKLVFAAGTAVVMALLVGLSLAAVALRQTVKERDHALAAEKAREKVINDILDNFQLWMEHDQAPGIYKSLNWPGRLAWTATTALGRPDAQRYIDAVIRSNPKEIEGWNSKIPYLVYTGDMEKYRHGCRELLRLFPVAEVRASTNPQGLANRIVKACLLVPGTLTTLTPEELDAFHQLLALEHSVFAHETIHYQRWSLLNFGLVAYRDGQYTRAIEELTRCNDGMAPHEQAERTAAAQILLAMSHHRLGSPADAEHWMKEAAATMEPLLATRSWANVSDDGLRYLILRREAEQLIQGAPQTTSSKPVSGANQH